MSKLCGHCVINLHCSQTHDLELWSEFDREQTSSSSDGRSVLTDMDSCPSTTPVHTGVVHRIATYPSSHIHVLLDSHSPISLPYARPGRTERRMPRCGPSQFPFQSHLCATFLVEHCPVTVSKGMQRADSELVSSHRLSGKSTQATGGYMNL